MARVVRFGDQDVIEPSLALAKLGGEGRYPGGAILPDPQTLVQLAFYNGRYDSQEEKYFAEPAV
jgi:hypothetical protein